MSARRAKILGNDVSGRFDNVAEIVAHIVEAGLSGVAEALDGMHARLDSLCRAAKKPRGVGIGSMFLED